tara:strand:+ start:263 stop:526 length:264 start_codon:yes stop_codon:yes gene_type:complete
MNNNPLTTTLISDILSVIDLTYTVFYQHRAIGIEHEVCQRAGTDLANTINELQGICNPAWLTEEEYDMVADATRELNNNFFTEEDYS